MKDKAEAARVVERYADTVRRICFLHLKNAHDAEDIFQEVFLRYILYAGDFESDDHERAWLLRVAINCCRNVLKSFYRRMVSSLETAKAEPSYIQEDGSEILKAVMKLPEKYRDVIYLFYYEGYPAVEMAKILNKNVNTVYTWLARAKARLKDELGGDQLDG